MRKKEIFWLIGTTSFVLILILWVFRIDGLKSEAFTDINIYYTYFVIENSHLIVLIITLIFFTVYLIRMLRQNFKNLTANLVFMISGLLSIWILAGMISMINSLIGVTETTEHNLHVTNNMFNNVSIILYLAQILIVGLMAYSGFKTVRNYKQAK